MDSLRKAFGSSHSRKHDDKDKLIKKDEKKAVMHPNQSGKNFSMSSSQKIPYNKFKNEKDVKRK